MEKKEFKVFISKKYKGEEDFMNKKLDEICLNEYLLRRQFIFLLALLQLVFSR